MAGIFPLPSCKERIVRDCARPLVSSAVPSEGRRLHRHLCGYSGKRKSRRLDFEKFSQLQDLDFDAGEIAIRELLLPIL